MPAHVSDLSHLYRLKSLDAMHELHDHCPGRRVVSDQITLVVAIEGCHPGNRPAHVPLLPSPALELPLWQAHMLLDRVPGIATPRTATPCCVEDASSGLSVAMSRVRLGQYRQARGRARRQEDNGDEGADYSSTRWLSTIFIWTQIGRWNDS